MRNHLTHVCSAPLGQASRRVRDPVPECFIWKLLIAQWLTHCFQVRCPGTWQESCSMNLVSQRGSAWWSGWKERRKWATPAQCCWTRNLAAFRAWNLDLESANHPGLRPFNPGVFLPLSLPYPGVRIRPVGLNQVGRVQNFYWKNDPEGWQVFGFWWILKFEMHTGPFGRFGPEPAWFQQLFVKQPCGLFPLLSCSHLAFPSSGISGHVAPWQVYGTSPVGESISKYHGCGRMDTKQKARSSSSLSRAGALVNPIFCTPDLERYTAR